MTDFELLQQYASKRSEAAFAALVEKYGGLVYSAALRQSGRPPDAEDITQVVFSILARKAGVLSSGTILAGWLVRTTHYVALNARRRDLRRWHTEMNATELYETETEATWKQIAPILDEALVCLSDKDRDAVILRFFERKSFRDIAQILRTSEDGAQKRVSRALEKLRARFTARGVFVASALVIGAISSKAVQAMPVHLTSALATRIVSGAGAASSISQLTERSLSALARARGKKLALRGGVAVILVLLTIFGVRQFKSSNSALRTVAQVSLLTQSPSARPNITPATNPQLSLGKLLLHVVDSQRGMPIANAQLRSISGRTNLLSTDRDGTAPISYDGAKEGLWSWRIEILKDGYEPKFIHWGAVRGDIFEEMPQEYTVKLEPGQVIGGSVADEKGESISDAHILIMDNSMPGGLMGGGLMEREARREGLALTHVETTDSQGRWMCNHVPGQLETVVLKVSHPDYIAASYRPVKIGPALNAATTQVSEDDLRNQAATMILKPGLVVAGMVADETGKPIGGAKVTENRAWFEPAVNQWTGPDGRFHFANLGPTELILTAQAPGYVGDDKTFHSSDHIDKVRFSLKKAQILRGHVVNEKQEPLAHAEVVAVGGDFEEGRFESQVFTDEQGRFEWLSAPVSQKLYNVWAAGYKTASRIELNPNGADQLVTLSREVRPPPARILGEVSDARTGLPIQAFQVWAETTLRKNTDSRFPSSTTFAPQLRTTGVHGKFSFLELQESADPLERLDIEIKANGYLSARCTVQAPLSNRCELFVRAEPFVSLNGTVHLPNGEPAAGAQVFLCGRTVTAWGTIQLEAAYMNLPGQVDIRLTRASSTTTDSRGQFVLEPKTTAGTLLAIHKSGYAESPIDSPSNPLTVRLEPWGAVSGMLRVIDAPGVGKVVSLGNLISTEPSAALRAHLTATTDSTGHFAFETVPPGRWLLSPHSVQVEVHPGKTAEVLLGGGGRRVIGKIASHESDLATDWKNYQLSLVTEPPGPAAPNREEFASQIDFEAAHRAWRSRRSDFLRSPEGQAALRDSRRYSCNLSSDGTFSFEEVLLGTYELTFSLGPSRQDDQEVRNRLAPFRRQIDVVDMTRGEQAVLDLGELEISH